MILCQLYYKFSECLENILKKQELSNDYAPLTDENFGIDNRPSIFIKSKRSYSNSNDELLSFFRNAVAKNYKLKSNIKTTRF